jgi:hypothetical protein
LGLNTAHAGYQITGILVFWPGNLLIREPVAG